MSTAWTVSRTNSTTPGRVAKVVGPRNALSTDRVSGGRIPPSSRAIRSRSPYSTFCRVPAGDAVQFINTALPIAIRIRRGERAADHAAPRVADEVRPVDPEPVEDVDDAAGAVGEVEHGGELLALAVTRRVDEDDAATIGEVVGLRRPHIAGHQQARPEHHRLAATASLYP